MTSAGEHTETQGIVRNVQVHCCCPQDLLQDYIAWSLSYLSSVDAPLAVDQLSLTNVDMPD